MITLLVCQMNGLSGLINILVKIVTPCRYYCGKEFFV